MTTATAPPPTGTRVCPKCGGQAPLDASECPRCGVVIAKALRARERERAAPPDPGSGWLGRLAAEQRLAVKQQVERLEAFTGIETTNAYAILDGAGNVLLHAEEEAGSVADFLVRNYLEALRPFTLRVATPHGETAFVVRRPLGALLLIDFAHFDDR